MFYFDTSILLPLLLPEETSAKIDLLFHQLPADADLVISQWTRVEFASVLSRLVRMGELEKEVALRCSDKFSTLLSENLHVRLPSVADFNLCWKYLTRYDNSLRAGDALHLAIAANLAVEKIYTLDKGMLKAGRQLGLPIETGIMM
ncbi:PilT domain protein [Desulfosarcina variabilis str. Montpellier]|uniref:type II toxin-antitoxin system VapC family toxin n=1 Tax=Desulfosarcina variabilis TaxID=2300 RepID=UPI003AFA28B4